MHSSPVFLPELGGEDADPSLWWDPGVQLTAIAHAGAVCVSRSW